MKPINNQILDYLAEHSFSFELDNDGQIIIYTNLVLVYHKDGTATAEPMPEEDDND